jgi:hypothetical protein
LIWVTTSGAVLPSEPGAPFGHSGTDECCATPAAANPSDTIKPQTNFIPDVIVTRIVAPQFAKLYRVA